MDPKVRLISEEHGQLSFTLSGCDTSLSNAVRRTILSDIEQIVFKPTEENSIIIHTNTSNLNNEILKQRLGCMPIHIRDKDNFALNNYVMELNVENITDTMLVVTSGDFTIKDLVADKFLTKEKVNEIFPQNEHTGHYIDFVRLKPKFSNETPGEKIHLTAKFYIGTAKEDGMFNAASTCSYGCTVDENTANEALDKKKQNWKDEGKTKEEVEFESKNWKLLEGMRYTVPNSLDFVIQTVGIYSNNELLDKACQVIVDKLNHIGETIEKDDIEIIKSTSTINNCFDVILKNDDYTIGKILEYVLYETFYKTKTLSYCGFNKLHPHDTHSIIRLGYTGVTDKSYVKGNLKEATEKLIQFFNKLRKEFQKLMKP